MGTQGANTGFNVDIGNYTSTAGTLFATGRNSYGTIGDGTTNSTSTFKQVGALTDWSQISYGQNWTAAIKTNGTLWTWGFNGNVGGYNGFLGIGNTISYSSPIQVGSLTNWSSVSTDGYSGLAIKTDGTLWAWGRNEHGQLGTATNVGSTTCFSSPIQIGALTDYSQVSTSGAHTMFVKTNGTLWGCGYAKNGALGNGVTVSGNPGRYPSPIQIGSLTNWSRVLCGYNTGLALKTDGTLWAWGQNNQGNLGNGTTVTYSSPIQIGLLTNWSKISYGAGQSFLAIKTDGTLWACGYGTYGTLGNGTTLKYSSPIQIGSLTTWSNVSTNDNVALALKTDGTLWAWGYDAYGQLGDGTTINKSSPIQIGNYNNWGNVFAGSTSFAIPSSTKTFDLQQDLGQRYVSKDYLLDVYPQIASATGARTAPGLWGCGYNRWGNLGNNTTVYYSSPIQIGSLTNWKQISARFGSNVMAVKTDGTLWAWGLNNLGQLGIGSTTNVSAPNQVGSLINWKQVSAGVQKFLAVKTDGTLWVCGYNGSGSLGNGVTAAAVRYSSPVQIGALTNWKQAASGFYSGGAIKTDGTLWTWGWNNSGEIGNGTTVTYYSPIQIGALTNWKQLEMSNQVAFAVKADGTLWAWGQNDTGQLGLNVGVSLKYSSPVQVGSLTNWKQISCQHGKTTAAIKTDGTLWTWGQNDTGQLGYEVVNFGTTNVSSPVQVAGGATWANTDATTYETTTNLSAAVSAYIKSDGTLWTWGLGAYGSLGNGTTIDYSSPVQVGSLTNWKQISGGDTHMLSIKTDGTLWAWGWNAGMGQLGNGTTIHYSSPIQVGSLTTWAYASAALYTSFGIKTDGTLWAWGWNSAGSLGIGNIIKYSSPVQVGSLTNWSKVKSNGGSTLAIKSDGTLWGWGNDAYGILGNGAQGSLGSHLYYSSPIQVGSLTNWKYIHVSAYAAHAVKTDGTMWTWGHEAGYGNMGVNSISYTVSSPVQIGSLTNWKYISGTSTMTSAIKTDGTLWAWGVGAYGSLGNGTTISYSSPIQVGALTTWVNVIGSRAVSSSGVLWAWGQNNYGQLGAPKTYLGNSSSPVQLGLLTNWKQVSAGFVNISAIKTDGTLWIWGSGEYGQLGNGTRVYYSSPIQVGSLTNWKQITCSYGWLAIADGYY